MAVRQCYGRRRKELKLGLYRWITSRGLLGIRRMDRVMNAWVRELCEVISGFIKELIKVFLGSLAMGREWIAKSLGRKVCW